MSDFRMVDGFEEVWRPPVGRRRRPETVLRPAVSPGEVRARLTRIAQRSPEVMVKVTGRTRDPAHLRAHLDYVTRNSALEMEGPEGWALDRAAVREVGDSWSFAALADSRRRANSPFSLSLVLSMPEGTDPAVVRDAARAFAGYAFGETFDYGFVLHTDEPHPHRPCCTARGPCAIRLADPPRQEWRGGSRPAAARRWPRGYGRG
jgi:hypothetical protein